MRNTLKAFSKKAYQPIYIQGSLSLDLLDYQCCLKVNKYLNFLFQRLYIYIFFQQFYISWY